MLRRFVVLRILLLFYVALAAQPDITRLGPQVGVAVPAFSGVDQFGRTHTLQSIMGSKGAMVVFFRSADW